MGVVAYAARSTVAVVAITIALAGVAVAAHDGQHASGAENHDVDTYQGDMMMTVGMIRLENV